ncbi:MAG: hypothetical protein ACK41T_03130 [Pseudobdellovibrio sp.]
MLTRNVGLRLIFFVSVDEISSNPPSITTVPAHLESLRVMGSVSCKVEIPLSAEDFSFDLFPQAVRVDRSDTKIKVFKITEYVTYSV